MRIFLVLICNLAFACVGYAAGEEHKPEPKKKAAKPAEHSEHKPEPKKKETKPAEHAAAHQGHPARGGRNGEEKKAGHAEAEKHPARTNKATASESSARGLVI
jgi:hypothetical protein